MSTTVFLFLDESGDFQEAGSRELGANEKATKFSSQLAGFFTTSEVKEHIAGDALNGLLLSAGVETRQLHTTDLRPDQKRALATSLCDALESKHWLPVRLTNLEAVDLGDRKETYLTLLGELACRLLERFAPEARQGLELQLLSATVVDGDDAQRTTWAKEDYTKALKRAVSLAALRRQGKVGGHWTIRPVTLGSGRRDPRLQICDAISHLSHDDFRVLDEKAAERLKHLLAEYDFSMSHCGLDRELRRQLDAGFLGSAAIQLVGAVTTEGVEISSARHALLDKLTTELASRKRRVRDTHLSLVLSWLEQIIEDCRDGQLALDAIDLFEKEVLIRVSEKIAPTHRHELEQAEFSLHRLALTACNHLGKLAKARQVEKRLAPLGAKLLARVENLPQIMEWRLASAVHETDQFRFDRALDLASGVRSYSEGLLALRNDLLAGWEQTHGSSGYELLGRALGTICQAEAYAALQRSSADGSRRGLQKALETSVRAENQFDDLGSKARQWQYQSQFYTYLGDYRRARQCLGRCLDSADSSHLGLSMALFSETTPDSFLVSHWLRVGARAVLGGDETESASFREAMRTHRKPIDEEAFLSISYPVHATLRHLAAGSAAGGDRDKSIRALDRLKSLQPLAKQQNILALIQLAAELEVAAVFPGSGAHWRAIKGILESRTLKLAVTLQARAEAAGQTLFADVTAEAHRKIGDVLSGSDEPRCLLGPASRVPY